MSQQRSCDICRNPMSDTEFDLTLRLNSDWLPTVAYRLERTDTSGYSDWLDICSAECLATAVVGEGHERGRREEHAAHRRLRTPQRRHWWQRRTA